MSKQQLSEQEEIRRDSLGELQKLGIRPFPSEAFPINAVSIEILEQYDPDNKNFQDITIAGRIGTRLCMSLLSPGRACLTIATF